MDGLWGHTEFEGKGLGTAIEKLLAGERASLDSLRLMAESRSDSPELEPGYP